MAYEKRKVKKLPKKGINTDARKKNAEYYEKNIEQTEKKSAVIKMSPQKSSDIKKRNADIPPADPSAGRKSEKKGFGQRRSQTARLPDMPRTDSREREKTRDVNYNSRRDTSEQTEPSLTVIDGGKTERKRENHRFLRTLAVLVVLVVAIVGIKACVPVSLFEWSQNFFSGIGPGGGYPREISGSKTVNLYSRGSMLFAMTDTSMYVYNGSGKEVTSYQHGYSNPVFVQSATRTLTYDRGNTGLRVDTLYTNLLDKKLDSAVITADICDHGDIAVVQKASGYAAQMTVYNRNFEAVFRWSSAESQLSSVLLSSGGKKVAVAAVGTENGKYVSTVSILNVSDGSLIASQRIENSLIVSLMGHGGRIVACGGDSLTSFDWDGQNRTDKALDSLTVVDNQNDKYIVTSQTPANSGMSTVTVFDNKLNTVTAVEIDRSINSVCISSGGIYCLSRNNLYHYANSGELKDEWTVGYEYIHLTPYKGGAAVSADMTAQRYK